MKRFKGWLDDVMFWPWFAWQVIAPGLFYDAMIPDREFSVTGKRLRDAVWFISHKFGLGWRETEPLWAGIRACYGFYREAKRAERECKRLVRKIQPLLRTYGKPGETPAEFLARVPEILKMAEIGRQAQREGYQPTAETPASGRPPPGPEKRRKSAPRAFGKSNGPDFEQISG
ncbi:MAG: hypothetical protein WBG50_02225 [Desulfomonilaceae bacterium]